MAEKIGFIGLGIMGRPMAKNLMEAGYELVLHNRSPEKAEELAKEGSATAAGSPREVAEACDTVITMLPDSPDVEAVVAGGDVGAIEGALSIMVGGSEEDFERVRPLFDVMGKVATHVGPTGAGQVVKACNQIVVALNIEAVSEALVLGSKAGVVPEKLGEALSGGLAGSAVMEAKKEKFFSHDFAPGFRIELHHKDLGIALAAGREYGVALPATAIVDQMLEALKAKGRGNRDHSALLTLLEEAAQHEIGEGS